MNSSITRALVVEDDHSWQQILSEILTDCGLKVEVAGNLDDAVFHLKNHSHRLAVVDLSLSAEDHNNYDGLRVLAAVRRLEPTCRTILLTGFATVELAVSVLTNYHAFTFLRKENFQRNSFREIVHNALVSAPFPMDSEQTNNINIVSFLKADPKTSFQELAKALVVEDDAGWRNLLGELLIDLGFQVRLCCSFGEALSYLQREKYTIAIVDLSLAGAESSLWDISQSGQKLDGYQLLSNTRANGIATIIVSGVASLEEIQRAYSEQSIFAYIEKQTFERTTFCRLVEEARSTHQVMNELNVLTNREREVLKLLAQGLTNKEIAENLVITTNTVKRHLKAIFEKLQVHTRSAAVAKVSGERN